jgi:hypothetical protein
MVFSSFPDLFLLGASEEAIEEVTNYTVATLSNLSAVQLFQLVSWSNYQLFKPFSYPPVQTSQQVQLVSFSNL